MTQSSEPTGTDVRGAGGLTPQVSRREGRSERELAAELGWSDAEIVGRTVTVNRPRQEVYAFWRNFQNFSSFMENIERIDVLDDRRSHWVVKAPVGTKVEWDAEIVEDVPEQSLGWESLPGADIKHTGRVLFRDGPPGRGTEVTVLLAYEPPAGDLGKIFAKIFQAEPQLQARRDLRRFKQLMETGEIATASAPDAAPHGTRH